MEEKVAGAPTPSPKMMSEPILERVERGQAVEPAMDTAAGHSHGTEMGRS